MFWVRALWAFAIFSLMAWLAGVGRRAVQQSLRRAKADPNAALAAGRLVQMGVLLFGVLTALAALGVDPSALAALVGLLTVAISLAVQDILRSFISGLYLLLEKPFQVGDTVQVAGEQGVVEDVGIRTTTMRTADGDRVIVPNSVLFTTLFKQRNNQEHS